MCADLTLSTAAFAALLDQVEQHSSVAGIRHILDDEAEQLLRQPQVIHNLQQLAEREWIFECQYPLTDTPATGNWKHFWKCTHCRSLLIMLAFPGKSGQPANMAGKSATSGRLSKRVGQGIRLGNAGPDFSA
ncbi:hypothetical protein [Aliamphritea spongicola]|nr:hypothetical protein [Aliamphritea spongicola]